MFKGQTNEDCDVTTETTKQETACAKVGLSSAKARFARFVIRLRERKHARQYAYGKVFREADGYLKENVRLNKRTGRVEFVLWKAGEQGHEQDYWYNMGYGWEDFFLPYNQKCNR